MFDHLNDDLVSRGLPTVNYGIDVHTGEVVAAHVGSQIRRQYSVIGGAPRTLSPGDTEPRSSVHDALV